MAERWTSGQDLDRRVQRVHQTSINVIMGPEPLHPSLSERTPLLSSSETVPNKSTVNAKREHERRQQLGFFGQVGLLLWKNLKQQSRSVKVTVAEILLPLLGAAIMLVVRQVIMVTDMAAPTTWSPLSLDSAPTSFVNRAILYAPNTTLVTAFMADVETSLGSQEKPSEQRAVSTDMRKSAAQWTYALNWPSVNVTGFPSESALENFYRFDASNTTQFPFSLIFNVEESMTTWPRDVTYTIRPRTEDKDKWQTRQVFSFYQVLSPRFDDSALYYNRSFAFIQRVVDEQLIRHWAPNASLNVSWQINRIPYPPYINDAMVQVLQQNFPSVLMLSFILSVIIMSKNIVYEKERQLKESMKLMGLTAGAHWTAWFLQFFIYLLLACGIYTLFMSVPVDSKKPVLVYSDPSLIFFFFLCYSISIITYCFFITTLVNKANTAAALAGILFFALFFPYYFLESRYEELTSSEKLSLCILFNMAMSYGMKTVGLYEGTGRGAQWSSFTEPASVDDNFSLLHAIIMLLVDSFIFLILTWYLDNVHPGRYGVPRPWYFPFQKSYWCGGQQKRTHSIKEVNGRILDHFEREPSGLPAGIRMMHLRKEYGPNKVAVADSTLSMFEGQITVLLGHNGAGKTTTMSILTGFIPPTSGTAYVNGYDIRTDINSVRSNLGLCPQHNILFDTLTVDEHLSFFASLKGCRRQDIPHLVADMAKEVGLESKRQAFAGTLSGGQKRKLSVGIALIGDSKIVILDEPTSGMDPAARRQLWEVLQRNRAGRTMLLSTHFMDEADILGDRIAIMAEGVIKCCGTSMFLKKLYGAGYHMIIVKGPTCNVETVTAAVQREISTAYLESQVGAELSYLLPENQSAKFPHLFSRIESNLEQLGITSFGASATTMEEVFLRVGASGSSTDKEEATLPHAGVNGFTNSGYESTGSLAKNVDSVAAADSTSAACFVNMHEQEIIAFKSDFKRLTNIQLHLSRFLGMFIKKAIHTFRNRIISGVQLALPVIFTIAALLVDKVRPKDMADPPLTLTLDMFDGTMAAYSTGSSPTPQILALGVSYKSLETEGNIFQEASNTNMTAFYLSLASEIGLFTYNKKVVMGAAFEPNPDKMTATAWYSGQPYHAIPVAVSYLMNAFARQATNGRSTITTINHPMPKSEQAAAQDELNNALMFGFSIGFSMLFGMAFLTSSFSYFLIRERQSGAKHLQVVSGVGPFSFWLASFAWDFVNYLIPCLVLLVVFAAFQVDAYVEDNHLWMVLLILLAFGLAVLPFIYLLQSPFSSPPTGFVVLIILSIVTGLFTMMTVSIMRMPSLDVTNIADGLDWVFLILFPHYSLGTSFSNFYINKLTSDYCSQVDAFVCLVSKLRNVINPCCKDACGDMCTPYEENFLAWQYPGVGRNIVFMVTQCLVFFAIVLILEYHVPQKIAYLFKGDQQGLPQAPVVNGAYYAEAIDDTLPSGSHHTEDSDVTAERQRVMSGGALNNTLVLRNLYKQYQNMVAVDNICVGVPKQECFGLLGQNGAGKTTTFKMLTGDVMLSSGDAFVQQHSVKTDIKQVQANMGYCPQFDALIDQMTGRETLYMYARLRGVPRASIQSIVDNLLSVLMLNDHADKQTGFYSGGNKRKLSTAIALVGNPAIILLDEPSSGMDPAARRQLWTVLSQVRASGRTLVLTSHSMEECDALCTRIAIMVNGKFRCLGSPQHLKSKFGQGYTLQVKMAILETGLLAGTKTLVEFILNKFPGSQKFDDLQGYVHFQVPSSTVPLSKVFTAMEYAKANLDVEDYSVHQTTLEQIFLTFTRAQFPPREAQTRGIIGAICPCMT